MKKTYSNIQKAFRKLERANLLVKECSMTCPCCNLRNLRVSAIESVSDGYVFYTIADAEYAAEHSTLLITYGSVQSDRDDDYEEDEIEDEENNETREIAGKICNVMGQAGLSTDWSGSGNARISVRLKPKDVKYVQDLVDRYEFKEMEAEAEEFRLRCLFFRWRRNAFRRRIARKRLAPAIIRWAFRPGGPISCLAGKDFNKMLIKDK